MTMTREKSKRHEKARKKARELQKENIESYWKGYLIREKKEEPTEGDSRAEGYWRDYLRKEKKRKLRERKDDPESLFADTREE